MSYNPDLSSDRDWVRFMTGDTNTAAEALADATIDAILLAEPNKWFAAATAAEAAFARWSAGAGGVISKTVGALSITRESGQSAHAAYLGYIQSLRARGARELSPAPYEFRVL